MCRACLTIGVAILAAAAARPATAQDASASAAPRLRSTPSTREVTAHRTVSDIVVDGRLDEAAWQAAEVADAFVQFQPNTGAPATQRTAVRILYDDHAVYVGAHLYDSAPDSIVARLARRDEQVFSDWFTVVLDSYFDRRTAFAFAVNPRGVKVDRQYSDDITEDPGWDAVWDVATARDRDGWIAEFRIPLSQLRFSGGPGELVWGINFRRYLARRDETADWAPVAGGGGAYVSQAGELRGLTDLAPARRLEVQPYVLAGVRRSPADPGDPLNDPVGAASAVGADLKLGITSDFTLSATLNPDFGQVEADPSVVNLSGFETFFPEQRPFFLEGAEIFRPTFPQFPAIFHSRRVGRPPQGSAPDDAVYQSAPDATSILGAAKLTGKTVTGWSLGLFDALTGAEHASIVDGSGVRAQAPIEPLTNYGAVRVARDLGRGRSVLGMLATSVHRSLPTGSALDFLPTSAYVLGVDGLHRFGGGQYQLAGSFFGSRVAGSASAIDRIQLSSVHRLNRPDASYAGYDPTRTVLSGYSANLSFQKRTGHWRVDSETRARSPGFEANDLGFLGRADIVNGFAHVWYDQFRAGRLFRNWQAHANVWTNWTYGGDRSWTGGGAWFRGQLANRWSVNTGGGYDLPRLNPDQLRGGPALRGDGLWWTWFDLATDPGRAVNATIHADYQREPSTGGTQLSTMVGLELRPSDRVSVKLGPSADHTLAPWQFVANRTVGDETAYVRGRLTQTTVSLTLRAAYTFTPTLSLQVYAQPFVSAGAYTDFSRVVDPRAAAYAERIVTYPTDAVRYDGAADRYEVDATGDGAVDFTFGNPDFTFRQLRSNVVLRWEYLPGSTLFVVWSQGMTLDGGDGRLRLGRDFVDLLGAPGTSRLTAKLSYRLGR